MEKYLDYSDIAIVPQTGVLSSRTKAITDTYQFIGGFNFKLPVIPANMKCVINQPLAKWLSDNYYFYIMHRFNIDIYEFIATANKEAWQCISVSIGFGEKDIAAIQRAVLEGLRIDIITVDVAHGDCYQMQNILDILNKIKAKKEYGNLLIIAGNVGTPHGYRNLSNWGADIVKIGIGGGGVCTTKLKTGVYTPMFTTIQKIREYADNEGIEALIIADGGIKHNGDIAKALVAGADFVMAGGIFAQCIDSPAEVNNFNHKIYYGSASEINKGHKNNIEGTVKNIESNNLTIADKLIEIKQDLQSTISYCGITDYYDLRSAEYIIV